MLPALLFALTAQTDAKPTTPAEYLAPVVAELSKVWPGNRMVEIVCHGHSVPAGYFQTPQVRAIDAYPNLLRQALGQRFPYAVINVSVTAIGGENSISGEKRFAQDVLTRHPDVVTIDYGLNDRGLDPAAVRTAWKSMVSQARAKGVKVILLTPTGDLTAKMDDANDPLTKQATAIRAIAKEENVGLVDSFAAFQKYTSTGKPLKDLMSQVNHPNRLGHDLVAAALLEWFPVSR